MDFLARLFSRKFEAVTTDAAAGGAATAPQGGTPPPENLIDAAKAGTKPANGETTDWFWSDGVKGTDKAPDWFDGKKYKSVAEQAKAYPDARKELDTLRGKLKGFTGAPEKYELAIPETLKDKLEWVADDPLLGQYQEVAKKHGMSQELFGELLGIFAQYEYTNMTPDWAKEKTALGERADQRLSDFWDWAGASFDEETATTVKRALGIAPSPAEIFMALEAVRSGTRQPAINNPGDDVRSTMTEGDWNKKWYAKSEKKGYSYLIDEPGNRERARGELQQIVGAGDHKVVVGQRKAS